MRCSKCRKELSEEEFSINPKTGEYYKQCNSCKEYYEQNKDRINNKKKEYREKK